MPAKCCSFPMLIFQLEQKWQTPYSGYWMVVGVCGWKFLISSCFLIWGLVHPHSFREAGSGKKVYSSFFWGLCKEHFYQISLWSHWCLGSISTHRRLAHEASLWSFGHQVQGKPCWTTVALSKPPWQFIASVGIILDRHAQWCEALIRNEWSGLAVILPSGIA